MLLENKNNSINAYINAKKLSKKIYINYLDTEIINILNKYNNNICLACSGGVDSLALLLITFFYFKNLRKKLKILYFKHNYRENDYLELDLVSMYAKSLNLQLIIGEAKKNFHKVSEESLRKERHAFFKDSLYKLKSKYLLTGHHFNDVAETFLMRFSRGSGINGLLCPNSISKQYYKDKQFFYLRPMINIEKNIIIKSMKESNIFWINDETNYTNKFYRNFIRNKIIKKWNNFLGDKYNLLKNIKNSYYLLKEDQQYLNNIVENIFKNKNNYNYINLNNISIDKAILRRIIYKLLNYNNITVNLSKKLCDLIISNIIIKKNFIININKNFKISYLKEKNDIFIVKETKKNFHKVFLFEIYENMKINIQDKIFLTMEVKIANKKLINKIISGYFSNKKFGFIDYDKIGKSKNFIIRNWNNGDFYNPLGMKGTKKIQDIFTDKKIDRIKRHNLPIICYKEFSNTIVWCPYLPISEKFKVDIQTKKIIRFNYIDAEENKNE